MVSWTDGLLLKDRGAHCVRPTPLLDLSITALMHLELKTADSAPPPEYSAERNLGQHAFSTVLQRHFRCCEEGRKRGGKKEKRKENLGWEHCDGEELGCKDY